MLILIGWEGNYSCERCFKGWKYLMEISDIYVYLMQNLLWKLPGSFWANFIEDNSMYNLF